MSTMAPSFSVFLWAGISSHSEIIMEKKSERPVDALALKNINYSLTDSLTISNQEMLSHLKI